MHDDCVQNLVKRFLLPFIWLCLVAQPLYVHAEDQVQAQSNHALNSSSMSSSNKPVLRVGLPSYDMVPYSYQHKTPSGSSVTEGLLITMLDQTSIKAGFEYELTLYPTFSAVLDAFRRGELDLLVGVSATKERQDYMAFSEPMFSIRRAVITQQRSINQLSDLATANLALEEGFALNDLLPSLLPDGRINRLTSTQDAFLAIKENQVDAYIGDALALSALLREQPQESLMLSLLPDLPADHLHFAVKKGKHRLLSRINFALEDIKQDSLTSIYNQWLAPSQHSMLLNYGTLNLTLEEQEWLERNPTIPVGVHGHWYPYDFINDQKQHDGLSADVLKLIGNVLGVSFETKTYLTTEAAEVAFNRGETMLLTNMTPTSEKARYMDFTQAYSYEPWVILSRADRFGSFTPSRSESIGIIENSGGATVLPSLCLACQGQTYINHVSAFQALQKEEIEYVLASLHHAAPLLHQDYLGQFKITGTITEQNNAQLAMAVNFRHPMLLSILNKTINALPPKELERLESKWLTYEYQEGLSPREVAKWSAIIGLTIGLIILAIIFWNRKMAAEIKQRKIAEERARAAETHLQTLADNIDGVVLKHTQVDISQPLSVQFSFVSAGVNDMFGLTAQTVQDTPQRLFQLFSAQGIRELETIIVQALPTGHWESEQQVKLPSGETKWVKFSSQVSHSSDTTSSKSSEPSDVEAPNKNRSNQQSAMQWNTVITDITLLKKQQQALDNARQKAESATAAKSQFLATISHEVRTPISGILGLLELMQEHQLNEELQSLHGGLTQSARNLLHIVNDVLDYSKIEAGKLELNPTDIELGKVLARIVQPQSIHAQQKGLAFHYWQDPALAQWLYADDIRLHQILNNFLNNAIKFTEHGTISLHVNVIESTQHQQKISLTVSDTGIGIPKDKQDALFQPFEQVDKTTSRRFGGTGLGLSIATKLIEQMEGVLTLDSDEGKGSDFTVTISLPISNTPDDEARYPLALPAFLDEQQQNPSLIANSSSEVYIVGFFLQQEELCRYLKHLDLKPKVLHINQKDLLQESVVQNKPKHIFVAMSVWQQLGITDAWIKAHAQTTSFTIINQSPMLSPEPLGSSWCLSVNPLLPDNLVHVLTKPVSHDYMPLQTTNEATSRFMQESREQAEKNGRLILVAEDHPINQQVIAKQLANIGVHADIVDNGLLALNALKEKRYGLLLTDCHMPEMDGYTLSASIRQLEAQSDEMHRELLKKMPGSELNEQDVSTLRSVGESFTAHRLNNINVDDSHQLNTLADYRLPIVALTANAVQGEDENCYAHGMDDFLVKPVSIKQMILTLEKWLPSLNDISSEVSKESSEQTASLSQDANDFSALFQDIEDGFETSKPPIGGEIAVADDTDDNTSSVIDFKALNELFGDADVAMSLLEEFETSFIDDWRTITQLWEEQRFKSLKTTAHRVKGAAKMVACDALATPLADIESLASELALQALEVSSAETQMLLYLQEVEAVATQFQQALNQIRHTLSREPQSKAYSYE